LSSNGHDVTLITGIKNAGSRNPDLPGRIHAVTSAPGDTFSPLFWKQSVGIFETLHSEKPFDAVLSEGSSAQGLLLFKQRPPLAALVHQFKPLHLFNNALEIDGLRPLASFLLRTAPRILRDGLVHERPFFRQSDMILCGAEHIRRRLTSLYGLDGDRLRVIPNAVDTDLFRPDVALRKRGRDSLNIPDGSFVALSLGRFQKTKGMDIAVSSFASAFKGRRDVFLVLAGGGDEGVKEYCRRRAQELGVTDRTLFPGTISPEGLPSLYNAADVFLMPSVLIEVLSYSVLEAMSCGVPVIATDREGNREAVGDAGALFRPWDVDGGAKALSLYEQDAELRRKHGDHARRRILDRFDARRFGRSYDEAVRSLADGNR